MGYCQQEWGVYVISVLCHSSLERAAEQLTLEYVEIQCFVGRSGHLDCRYVHSSSADVQKMLPVGPDTDAPLIHILLQESLLMNT